MRLFFHNIQELSDVTETCLQIPGARVQYVKRNSECAHIGSFERYFQPTRRLQPAPD